MLLDPVAVNQAIEGNLHDSVGAGGGNGRLIAENWSGFLYVISVDNLWGIMISMMLLSMIRRRKIKIKNRGRKSSALIRFIVKPSSCKTI